MLIDQQKAKEYRDDESDNGQKKKSQATKIVDLCDDFDLFYAVSEKDVGLNLVSFREHEGSFD